MKKRKFKKMLPLFLFIALLTITPTVFASKMYTTTISVGRGKTVKTSSYSMPSGTARIGYSITKINGSSNKNDANSTKIHIIMRDGNDTAILDKYRTHDQTWYGGYTIVEGNTTAPAGKWYAQVSTKINGTNYASFYSNEFSLVSLTS